MAITSELIGSLNLPGYGFYSTTATTYELPSYSKGLSILTVRWSGSKGISYDLLDKDTGKVVKEERTSSFAHWENIEAVNTDGIDTKKLLLRINNSTPMQVYIIPNPKQDPPVWNG